MFKTGRIMGYLFFMLCCVSLADHVSTGMAWLATASAFFLCAPLGLIAGDIHRGMWDGEIQRLSLAKNRLGARYRGLAETASRIDLAMALRRLMYIVLFFNLCLLGSYLDEDPDSIWFSTNVLLRMAVLLAPLALVGGGTRGR